MWPESLDSYTNLILLCKVHHKLIDDQPNRFTSENMRILKRAHAEWVRLTLGTVASDEKSDAQPVVTWRIQSGKEITNLLAGAQAYHLDNDDPETAEEANLIGGFLQTVHDWGEIWSEIDPAGRINAQLSISEDIKILEAAGFVVFGTTRLSPITVDGERLVLRTAVVQVLRSNNPNIIDVGSLMGQTGSTIV